MPSIGGGLSARLQLCASQGHDDLGDDELLVTHTRERDDLESAKALAASNFFLRETLCPLGDTKGCNDTQAPTWQVT